MPDIGLTKEKVVVGVLGGEEGLEAGGPDEAVKNAALLVDRVDGTIPAGSVDEASGLFAQQVEDNNGEPRKEEGQSERVHMLSTRK